MYSIEFQSEIDNEENEENIEESEDEEEGDESDRQFMRNLSDDGNFHLFFVC